MDRLSVMVMVELAEHVPSCCLNLESAFVEFHGSGHHVQASFALRESRPAHQLEATVRLPEPGLYSYRVVAKILQRSLTREGSYEVHRVAHSAADRAGGKP